MSHGKQGIGNAGAYHTANLGTVNGWECSHWWDTGWKGSKRKWFNLPCQWLPTPAISFWGFDVNLETSVVCSLVPFGQHEITQGGWIFQTGRPIALHFFEKTTGPGHKSLEGQFHGPLGRTHLLKPVGPLADGFFGQGASKYHLGQYHCYNNYNTSNFTSQHLHSPTFCPKKQTFRPGVQPLR